MSQATEIMNRISAAEPGTVFIAADFSDLGPRDNVNQVLSRLVRRGDVIRAVRGVYGKPKWSRYFKVWLQPSPNKVAHGIARMNGWVISPSADYALNKLGLDNQVPARYEYASTGPSRVYKYGQFDILMHHHATRDLIGCSPITMLVNLALRALGREEVSDALAERLVGQLAPEDIEAYFKETRDNSSWIHEFARNMKEKRGSREAMPYDAAKFLETDEDVAAYLNAALEDGDPALLSATLGDIARARGMTRLARETGITRDGLYKALSPTGNPSFVTVQKVIRALGCKIDVKPTVA